MKIAAAGEGEATREFCVEFVYTGTHGFIAERIIRAGMRSADDMGDAIGDRVFGHSKRVVDGFCAVIHAWQDVTVEVDHVVPVCGINAKP